MTRVRIIGLKSDLGQTVEALQEFGRIHFEDVSSRIETGELSIRGMAMPEKAGQQHATLSEQLQRTRAIVQGLFGDADIAPASDAGLAAVRAADNDELIANCERVLDSTGTTAEELVAKQAATSAELSELARYEPMLKKVEPMVTELLESHDDAEAIALIVEKRYRPVLNELRDALTQLTDGQSTLVVESVSEESVAAVAAFGRSQSAAVHAFIADENVNQIALPQRYEGVPLPEALADMRRRIAMLPTEASLAAKEIADFANRHRDSLANMRNTLDDRVQQLDLYETFGETAYTFIISGFVPSDETEAMRELLVARCGPDVLIEEVPIRPETYEEVPVELKNPPRRKAFEMAVGIWGTPRYGSIDPTTILSWTFPFIFGMIVGDFGYGSLILLVCIFLRTRFRDNAAAQVYAGLMTPTALMTMFFGLMYWEMFGDLAHVYIPGLKDVTPVQLGDAFSFPFIRTSQDLLTSFLLMAVAVGVIHVMFGLALGYASARRVGHVGHMREKLGLILLVAGAILLALISTVPAIEDSLGSATSILKILTYLMMAGGFAVALWGGGVMGAIETVETVSHMASYIRIMAVGLVGAMLADASNKLAFVQMPNAVGGFIAIVLHVLNFAIILFSPAIHALRLNFLEFFGKFFERGHVLYRPFVRSIEKGMS